MANHGTRFRKWRALGSLAISLALPLAAAEPIGNGDVWLVALLDELCGRYGVAQPLGEASGARLDELTAKIGRRLAEGTSAAVPSADVATLALLLSKREALPKAGGPPASAAMQLPAAAHQAFPASQTAGQSGTPTDSNAPAQPDRPLSDVQKGQEGFRQGVERLRELPPSERFVITGDITSGAQAATVSEAPELTSIFGRARVNVVARAVPASADGTLSEGHFFVQLIAAGGPFDSTPVGGPALFGSFNDVATDRSRFNEGISRGNLYVGRAFYQQELRLGENSLSGRVGMIDLTDFFDTNLFANNEARQFLNSSLVNSSGFKTGLVAPGVMGEYRKKMHESWLDGAVLRGGYAVSRTARAFTSPVWTSELELNTILGGLRGNWRVGGTVGNVADAGGIQGIHVSADHWLSRSAGTFGRYSWSNSGKGSVALSPVQQSYSGGFQWRFTGREDRISALAIGFSQAFPIDKSLASEKVFETYYRWQFARNFSLSPDFQLVVGSGGRQRRGTQAVFGVRMFFGL